MPPVIAANILDAIALERYRVPSITAYNRLEASPRTADLSRSLKSEVRDALWMLTRQWQFGEFQAEDAGSPVGAQIVSEHTVMERVSFPGGRSFALDPKIPLETQVERERLEGSLFLAVQLARYFLRLMRDNGLFAAHHARLVQKFPLEYAIERNDVDALQLRAAVDGELFDGFALHTDIVTTVAGVTRFQKWMNEEGISAEQQTKFIEIAARFEAWFARNYSQPAGDETAWLPSQLEYQFEVSQLGNRLTADQYCEGHLDWYSFDFDRKIIPAEPRVGARRGGPAAGSTVATNDGATGAVENFVSFIPGPIGFKGMPNPRFWTLEDGQINFGTLDTSATGLLHLLFAEFGLIYGNDWFVLPYPMSINTMCEIRGITVTDVFGQHTLVRPAGRKGDRDSWQRWTMFHHTDSQTRSDTSFYYLSPSITKSLEGDPLERVNFLRDEMANLVWAVESTVPSQAGKGVNGNEIALKDAPPPAFAPVNDKVQIRYVAGTTVPDNWIPFIPVPNENSAREIRLQRARMPAAKGALGVLLNEKAAPYYLNEEEIPRAGIEVMRFFQRTRWLNGRTCLWIGRFKQAGKGEGWSNLRFDQIVDIPQNLK